MNPGFPYSAHRRDKTNDIPEAEGHEWTVQTSAGYTVDPTLAFPDTHAGWTIAHNIAEAMNAAHTEGMERVRDGINAILRGEAT